MISVIIPTFNHSRFVSDAINSVLAQTYKNLEVIIVDDGSTDNTREVLKKYGSKIKYIYQNNKGLSAARNIGIKFSKGEFIAILDADDIWLSRKLELQMKMMEECTSSTGVVSCGVYIIDEEGKIIKEFVRKNYLSKINFFNELIIKNIVSGGGSCALIRRVCFEKVGMFDENLKSAEDWDMWLRISKYFDIKYVEIPLVKIRVSERSMSSPINVSKMLKNELQVLKKVFSDKSLKKKWCIKRKSYSYRYFCAAWAFNEIGKKKEAFYYNLKSLLLYPFKIPIAEGSHLGLLLKILLGNKVFRKLKKQMVTLRTNF